MVRAGFLHSPARIAINSKPHSAPKVILLNTLRLNRVARGATSGSACDADPARPQNRIAASRIKVASAIMLMNPPALITHFPMRNPSADTTTRTPTRSRDETRIIPLLAAIDAALGPMANEAVAHRRKPHVRTHRW